MHVVSARMTHKRIRKRCSPISSWHPWCHSISSQVDKGFVLTHVAPLAVHYLLQFASWFECFCFLQAPISDLGKTPSNSIENLVNTLSWAATLLCCGFLSFYQHLDHVSHIHQAR